jgi:hypothetical protein
VVQETNLLARNSTLLTRDCIRRGSWEVSPEVISHCGIIMSLTMYRIFETVVPAEVVVAVVTPGCHSHRRRPRLKSY